MALDVIPWILELIGNSSLCKPRKDLPVIQIEPDSNITRTIHSFSICCSWTVGYSNNLNYRFVHSVSQSLQYPTEVNKTDTVLLSTHLHKAMRV